MNRVLWSLLLITLCVLPVPLALAEPYHHPPTSLVLRDTLGSLQKVRVTELKTEEPGRDVFISYRAPGVVLSAFVFIVSSPVSSDLDDPDVRRAFDGAVSQMQKPLGENTQKPPEEKITIGAVQDGPKPLVAQFARNNEKQQTDKIFLTTYRGYFVKFLYTCRGDAPKCEQTWKDTLHDASGTLK